MKRKASSSALLALALLGAGAVQAAEAAPKEGTFEGSMDVAGTTQAVQMGGVTVSLARITGKVKLRTADGLAAREFDAVCNVVSDQKTGGVGRCTWTDANGDTLLLELSGSIIGPAGTSREAVGRVVGGTGRYAGLEGDIDLEWLFVDSTLDDTRFKGYVTKLQGRWRRP